MFLINLFLIGTESAGAIPFGVSVFLCFTLLYNVLILLSIKAPCWLSSFYGSSSLFHCASLDLLWAIDMVYV